jgi:hypothetical protein
MAETIICPKCGCDVTEVMSVQLKSEIRHELSLEWRQKEADLAKERSGLESQRAAIAQEKLGIEAEVAKRTTEAKKRLKIRAQKKAREKFAAELQASQTELGELRTALQQAKNNELALRKARQQLEEEKQNLELTKARQLDAERVSIKEAAKKQSDEEHRLNIAQYEKRISDMGKELDAARRIAEQGSQQLQGEVLELDLEELLRQQFPCDEIRPVPKGIRGADVIQVVRDSSLAECGAIIWESKRTANWSNTWLPKLRDDQRAANACIAILVTEKLPPKMNGSFELIDGTWITNRSCCFALATALRFGLLDVAAARRALEGQNGKMEALYNYLSGPIFKNRVNGIVEAFTTMQQDLVKEKKAIVAIWSKREQQINQALKNTSGFHGDLQGIIGGSMPAVESLEFPSLPSPEGELEEMASGSLFRR